MNIADIVALICGLILVGFFVYALRYAGRQRAWQAGPDQAARRSDPYPRSGYGSADPHTTGAAGGHLYGGFGGFGGGGGCDGGGAGGSCG